MIKILSILMVLILCGCEKPKEPNNPCDADFDSMTKTKAIYFLSKCVVDIRKELSEIKEILKAQAVRK